MVNYNSMMMGGFPPKMPQAPDHFEIMSSSSVGHLGGLVLPMMPEYNYEERRNSGTTGGSSNAAKAAKLLSSKNNNKNMTKKQPSGPYPTKGRRSSNSTSGIPPDVADDKSVEYKGQSQTTISELSAKMKLMQTTVADYAKNQQGSKFLQRVLAKASPDVIEYIVVEVGDSLQNLMVDSYGNYFCQKLLQSSSSKQRLYLLKKISPYIVSIS